MPAPPAPPFDDEDVLGDDDLLGDEEEEWVTLGGEVPYGGRAALFSSHTQAFNYAKFRPTYPPEVYQRIYDFAALAQGGRQPGQSSSELALDVGCGPGSVAVELAKTYAQVIGVDPSEKQLDHAEQAPNVRYICVAAEYLGRYLPPQSVDLIAMAETLHWLDHIAFYEQCRKILKPTGVLVMWCYDLFEFAPMGPQQTKEACDQANAIMRAYTYGLMGPFWDERRVYIDRRYAGLEPKPTVFRTVIREQSSMEKIMSMQHLVGFLSSWSPYAAYRKTYPDKEDPLIDLSRQFRQLLQVTDDAAPTLRIVFPLFYLNARDPVQEP